MPDDETAVPQKTTEDHARELTKVVASLIPTAGGVANILIDRLWRSPLQRRLQQFHSSIAAGLIELTHRVDGLSIESNTRTSP